MVFDPEMFGQAMGEAIQRAIAPLHAQIAELKAQIAALPTPSDGRDGADGKDGKDCDMEQVRAMIDEAVKAVPVIHGKDGEDGKDGNSIALEDVQDHVDKAIREMRAEAERTIAEVVKAIPPPKDGIDGRDGKDGEKGDRGEKGEDGAGMADLLIDREGALVATYTDGRMKNLGRVVGNDGKDGKDGADGVGLDSFELEYSPETHEVCIKASAGTRTRELRYPAGGIRPAGYWRDGKQAKPGEAWVHDGSLWIATKDTEEKPDTKSEGWIIAARRGRDGERGPKGGDGAPPTPIPVRG